ncbi:transcription elongation factor TFIIS [Ricinus communis]|uniref:transcription elongation factor TFIIS n=1 Tax=Ricinus communis TaxID=3988 RepID=UPI00201AB2C7|nr:transcription elongation factor TFIIS [Ricinus communis]
MLEDKTSVKSTENIKIEKTRTIKVEAKTEHKGEPRSAKVVESECLLRSPRMKSIPKCNDPSRDTIREQLYEALCKVSSEANEEIQKEVNACDAIGVAVAVESALFSNWGPSNGSDRIKYRSLIFNIRDAKNPDFRRKVLLGQVKPERIAELSSEEMASDERRKKNKEIKEKALLVCQLAGAPKATTDQFKCGRCGQRKTSYYQMQTRSADEPMTTYVTCVNCSNRWKMH